MPAGDPASGAEPSFVEGAKLAGIYVLQQQTSASAFGSVWIAKDEVLGRNVLLHILPDAVRRDAAAMQQLRQAVRAHRTLIHPNILRVHAMAEEGEWAAISMGQATVRSLEDLLREKEGGFFEPSEIRAWVQQLCLTIGEAHHIEALHRNVAPANVFIGEDGRLLVGNFAISRIMADALRRAGQSDADLESRVGYFSPQQLAGEAATPADDIYAVGATIHALLTGAPPSRTHAEPLPMSETRLQRGKRGGLILPTWERTVAACLAQYPVDRPQSASDLVAKLGLGGKVFTAPSVPAPAATPAAPAPASSAGPTPPAASTSAPAAPSKTLLPKPGPAVKPAAEKRPPAVERTRTAPAAPSPAPASASAKTFDEIAAAVAADEWADELDRLEQKADKSEPFSRFAGPARRRRFPVGLVTALLLLAAIGAGAPYAMKALRNFRQPSAEEAVPPPEAPNSDDAKPHEAGNPSNDVAAPQQAATDSPRVATGPPSSTPAPESAPAVAASGEFPPAAPPPDVLEASAAKSALGASDPEKLSDKEMLLAMGRPNEATAAAPTVPTPENDVAPPNDAPEAPAPAVPAPGASDASPTPAASDAAPPSPAPANAAQNDRENSLGLEFVPVAGVEFCIWLTRVKDFEVFAKETSLQASDWRNPGFQQGPDEPVVNVTWDQAMAFCKWLTEREHRGGMLPEHVYYRLPTDQEWSEAAGLPKEAGKTPQARDGKLPGIYFWGSQWPPPVNAGNFAGREAKVENAIKDYDDGFPYTSPVGSFPPNKFGLHDMGGNVWQWTMDSWNPSTKAKALRGGSWHTGDFKQKLLASDRLHGVPDRSTTAIGFRVVRATQSEPAGGSR